ncbi:MAG: HD domain-containing phosphohydrolase [Planctomycetaceae bacterium]|nr:HD domain-containing phosphohydrolase [Planctomycetaceae bacterium]
MPTFCTLSYGAQALEPLVEPGVIRTSEVLSALSLALDLTEGQASGHAIRSALIGMRIAQEISLPVVGQSALFYAMILKDLGCSSNAAKMAWLFGADDRGVKRDIKLIDWTKVSEKAMFAWRQVAPGGGTLQKMLRLAVMAREGEQGEAQLVEQRCERGAEIARELDMPVATAQAIRSLDEHWNGKGHPVGLKGEEIPLLSRIMNLAQTVEVFCMTQGPFAALHMAHERSGRWFDPRLVRALLSTRVDSDFWASLLNEDLHATLAAWEPEDEQRYADADGLDRISEGFARVVDSKSPWTYKHSTGVADIAVGIADMLGFDAPARRDLRRAGLLHDLGKLGVSNAILDKPGKPTDEEFAQIKLHPDYSLKILSQVPLFGRLADVASAHHERLDGRGYHRRLPGDSMPLEARILAVADVYEALTAARPYRDGMPREKALSIMKKDAGQHLCAECIAALEMWLDRTSITPRVEAQLQALDRLHNELSGRPAAREAVTAG